VKYLSDKKLKLLADRHGWSLTRAKGFLEGERSRRRGAMPSPYAQIGTDEYCAGFRAGYYERDGAQPQDSAKKSARNLGKTPEGAQEG
jgi:hypothetical protein